MSHPDRFRVFPCHECLSCSPHLSSPIPYLYIWSSCPCWVSLPQPLCFTSVCSSCKCPCAVYSIGCHYLYLLCSAVTLGLLSVLDDSSLTLWDYVLIIIKSLWYSWPLVIADTVSSGFVPSHVK